MLKDNITWIKFQFDMFFSDDMPSSTALDPDGQNVTGHYKWLSDIDLWTHSIFGITYIIP